MKPLIYLSGPITKPDPNVNAHGAIRVADMLMDEYPITLFIPHLSVVHQLVQPKTHQQWLEYDFGIIRHCQALFRLPGESIGADMEVKWAHALNLPVFEVSPGMDRSTVLATETFRFTEWLRKKQSWSDPDWENHLANVRADIEDWVDDQRRRHADYGLIS